jgi:hypothetical protein
MSKSPQQSEFLSDLLRSVAGQPLRPAGGHVFCGEQSAISSTHISARSPQRKSAQLGQAVEVLQIEHLNNPLFPIHREADGESIPCPEAAGYLIHRQPKFEGAPTSPISDPNPCPFDFYGVQPHAWGRVLFMAPVGATP